MLMNDAAMATPIIQTGLIAISLRTALELNRLNLACLIDVWS